MNKCIKIISQIEIVDHCQRTERQRRGSYTVFKHQWMTRPLVTEDYWAIDCRASYHATSREGFTLNSGIQT